MSFQVRAVEDVDHPDFEKSLSPENQEYVQSVGKDFLKTLLRRDGLPEKRPAIVRSSPAPAMKFPSLPK